MSTPQRRPQTSKRRFFSEDTGYKRIWVRTRSNRTVRRWTRVIPALSADTPHPGVAPAPFWPPFFNAVPRGILRSRLATAASKIFVDEAIRLEKLPRLTIVEQVHPSDLDRVADEAEEFLQAIADAQIGLTTDARLHGDIEFLIEVGGLHFALARLGSEFAFDIYDDPDPRRQLIAEAQARPMNPPFIDEDGWVRLYPSGPPR